MAERILHLQHLLRLGHKKALIAPPFHFDRKNERKTNEISRITIYLFENASPVRIIVVAYLINGFHHMLPAL